MIRSKRRCVPAALFVIGILTATLMVACSTPPPETEQQVVVGPVTILGMTDFHGAVSGGGTERNSGRPWGGALALADRIRAARKAAPARTFLFDAGDEMQGTPESNFTSGRASIVVLNALGVDAAAVGNHEFDWGIDTLRARRREMRYPMLGANVIERATGRRPDWIGATTIVVRDGVRVGVIGYVTPDTPRVTLPLHVESLRFDPPAASVVEHARALREAGAHLVVVVCHLGGEQSRDGTIEGEIAELAAAARGHVDAIVGGHTHTFVAGTVAGIPCVIAGSSGRALGRIVLDWDGKLVRSATVAYERAFADSLQSAAGDPLVALVDSMQAVVRPYTSRVLGRAAKRLDRNALANLVTDAMRHATGADIAITNPGGLRRDLAAGPITAGDIFELLPFENALVDVELTGAQLRTVIASRPSKCRVAGLTGRTDPGAAPPGDLVLTLENGSPLEAGATYRVVTNSFIATGGDGFSGWDAGRVTMRPETIRDAVTTWIERETAAGRAIDPSSAVRFVVPASE